LLHVITQPKIKYKIMKMTKTRNREKAKNIFYYRVVDLAEDRKGEMQEH